MKLGRAAGGGLVYAVCLASCNALTGAGDLDVIDVMEGPSESSEDVGTSSPDGATLASDGASSDDDAGLTTSDAETPSDASDDASPDADPPCVPASVGPRYGTVATSLTSGTWSFRNGILAPNDGQYAHSNGENGTIEVSGFGFALPAGAEVRGIGVRIRRTADGPLSDSVRLPKGASKTGGAWPQGDESGPYQLATYGGTADTWGASWTSAEINAETFGVRLSVTGTGDGHADSLSVTVHYCD